MDKTLASYPEGDVRSLKIWKHVPLIESPRR